MIPEFIKYLGKSDDEIAKIKPKEIKTNLPFIDDIRNELKNKILQVKAAIKKGEIKVGKQDTDHEDSADDHEDHGDEAVAEEEEEQEQDEAADSQIAEEEDDYAESARSAGGKNKSKLKTNSKQISKFKTKTIIKKIPDATSDAWRRYAYLKETIKGKQFELKRLQLELREKYNFLKEPSEPSTPPPTGWVPLHLYGN